MPEAATQGQKRDRRDYHKAYGAANRDKKIAYCRAYYAANRERLRAQQAVYKAEQAEKEQPEAAAKRKKQACDQAKAKLVAQSELREVTAANTRRSWLYRLKRRGISEEVYIQFLKAQGGCCAICRRDKPWTRNDSWAVDHDHVTGRVRGLLCHECNRGLGMFHDDSASLERAIAYLAKKRGN